MRTTRYSPYQFHATPPRHGTMDHQFTPINPSHSSQLPPFPLTPSYNFPYATAPPSPGHLPFSHYDSPQHSQEFVSTPTPQHFASTSAMLIDERSDGDGLESRRRSSGYGSSLFDSLPFLCPTLHPSYASSAPTDFSRRSSLASATSENSTPLRSIREARRSSDPSQDRDRSTSTVRRLSAPVQIVQATTTTGGAIVVTDDFPDLPNKAGVTSFIAKLHSALENPGVFGDCLRWSANGQSFLIDLGRFPLFFNFRLPAHRNLPQRILDWSTRSFHISTVTPR